MRISSGNVSMTSAYKYVKTVQMQEISTSTKKGPAAQIQLNSSVNPAKIQTEKNTKNKRNRGTKPDLETEQSAKTNETEESKVKSKEEIEYETLKKILEMLRGKSDRKLRPIDLGKMMDLDLDPSKNILDLTTDEYLQQAEVQIQPRTPTVWTRTTVTSSFVAEAETTAFTGVGTAKTADGRELNFGVTFEMSRSFAAEYTSVSEMDYVVCDPLVINLTDPTATVTDQKFMFDLNCEGEEESISFAGEGSGFLALDKNKDGKINDGNELFGTASGNGFSDLAKYDHDSNGWIDEADEVFQDLKIWTKDSKGNDKLVSLKEAGVGAIYLGSTDTSFSYNNASNETNGILRKTGVYLRESGVAGTIQHLDLTI